MQKKISVVLPVYNGERYLRRCINSILQQSDFNINDLDILALDDGSRDRSLAILEEYQAQHRSIIRVISQQNMGVAKTRNKGIQQAQGKYIIFIDQDDYIDNTYCKTFYEHIELAGADVVSGGYRRPDEKGRVRQISLPKVNTEYSKYIVMAAWAKIHRTEFLKKNKIEFFSNKFGEDNVFTVKEISSTSRWLQINYIGYNWFYNTESVSNTSQKGLLKNDRDALITLLKKIIEISRQDTSLHMFQYYFLRTSVFYLLFSGRRATPNRFLKFYDELNVLLEANFPGMYRSPFFIYGPRGETIFARLTILAFITLHKFHLIRLFSELYCKG